MQSGFIHSTERTWLFGLTMNQISTPTHAVRPAIYKSSTNVLKPEPCNTINPHFIISHMHTLSCYSNKNMQRELKKEKSIFTGASWGTPVGFIGPGNIALILLLESIRLSAHNV